MKQPHPYSTDAELIEALQQTTTQDKALKQLYVQYFETVRRLIANNNGTVEDAEDIFQETVVVFYDDIQRPEFILTASIKTYLYSVSRNLWLKHLRKKGKIQIVMDTEEDYTQAVIPDETYDADTDLLIQKALKHLATLGENCRKILHLFFWEKKSMDEIAQEVGYTNADNAKNQKAKCMRQLREKYETQQPF